MKAMLLAAGRGERMRPLTDSTAKPLLKVAERSLIEHNILLLKQAGVEDLVINLHHCGDQIKAQLGDGEQFGVRISYSHEAELLDTAGGIRHALKLLGSEPFMVVNADIYCNYDFAPLSRLNLPESGVIGASGQQILAHLVLVKNPQHNPQGDFAVSQQAVAGLSLLDAKGVEKHTWSGISVLHPELFKGLPVGPLPMREILHPAIAAKTVTGEIFMGDWTDVGTPERLEELNRQFADS